MDLIVVADEAGDLSGVIQHIQQGGQLNRARRVVRRLRSLDDLPGVEELDPRRGLPNRVEARLADELLGG